MVRPSSYRVHPHFNILLAKLDIALIILPNVVKFTKAIQPVKLPTGFQLEESFSGETGVISGKNKKQKMFMLVSIENKY